MAACVYVAFCVPVRASKIFVHDAQGRPRLKKTFLGENRMAGP